MIKISELKQKEVRTKFNYIGSDNQEHEIIIYNPTVEAREKILNLVGSNMDNEAEMLVDGKDMLSLVIPLLTNIEIDVEDVNDILANPTKEMLMVNAEIQSIINEISMEILLAKRLELETMLLTLEQVKSLNMLSYIKAKADSYKPLQDFDPLNSNAKEARDRIQLNEAKATLDSTKEIYRILKETEKKEVDK